MIVEQFSVKPNAAQKESEFISRSITATRQAYGLTRTSSYRDYTGNAPPTPSRWPPTGRPPQHPTPGPDDHQPGVHPVPAGQELLLLPRSALDRPLHQWRRLPARLRGGCPRAQPGPADRQPARLDQPPHRLHPRQRLHREPGQHGAQESPTTPTRTAATRSSWPASSGPTAASSPLPAPLDQPRVYFGPVIASAPTTTRSSAERQRPRVRLRDQHRDQELHLHRRRRVSVGNLMARAVFAAKFAERNFLFSNVIGSNSKILFNRDPADRVGRSPVADDGLHRLPGDRQQADGVDHRRLHHAGQLPVFRTDEPGVRRRRTPPRWPSTGCCRTRRCPISATR